MNCRTPYIGWLFHDWHRTIHYPSLVSDGAGGCWAGHLVEDCRTCGAKRSRGIWAADEVPVGTGKCWHSMRDANPDELKEHGIL